MPPSTTPHMPGTSVRRSPRSMWQVDVPMIATSRPGSTTPAAGTVTCASTLATATAIPAGRPIQPAASAVRSPARPPSGGEIASSAWRRRRIGEARVERAEVVTRRVGAVLVVRLVAGGAGVARLDAAHAPDDPVGRLDQPIGGAIDLGRLLEDLQRLGEEPFARDLAAVARQPGLAARARRAR